MANEEYSDLSHTMVLSAMPKKTYLDNGTVEQPMRCLQFGIESPYARFEPLKTHTFDESIEQFLAK